VKHEKAWKSLFLPTIDKQGFSCRIHKAHFTIAQASSAINIVLPVSYLGNVNYNPNIICN